MRARHRVSGIEQRGHIYYWRPRLPPRLRTACGRSRLTISLGQYDFRHACYIARRLSLLLDEMEMTPGPLDTTYDQLRRLFDGELERMRHHLENVALIARRHGRDGAPEEIERDLEMGWAYRILQYWGAAEHLTFADGCPAYAMLIEAGIPDSKIGWIAELVRSEGAVIRSPGFEHKLVALMADFGIPDTITGRERAKIEWLRTRADALLDAGSRLPIGRTIKQATMEAPQVASVPAAHHETPVLPVAFEQAPSPPAHSTDAASQDASTAERTAPALLDLPIDQFFSIGEIVNKTHDSAWSKDTKSDFSSFLRLFVASLKECKINSSSQITQYHIGHFCDLLAEIPTRYGQSARMRSMTPQQLRQEGALIRQRHGGASKLPSPSARQSERRVVGLSALTIRKHLGNLSIFLQYLRSHGYSVATFDINGLRPRKPTKSQVRTQQFKPRPQDIARLFASPIYQGCLDAHAMGMTGGEIFHCALYWVPIFLVYLGPRRNEICSLEVSDIVFNTGIPYFYIAPNSFRSVKTSKSIRTLPIPDEALRLGFYDYWLAIKKLGYRVLFPELMSTTKKEQDLGDRFYKEFKPIAASTLAGDIWSRLLHALRHGFTNNAIRAKLNPVVIDDVTGRVGTTGTGTRYSDDAEVALMAEEIRDLPIVTSHVQKHDTQLLPWVADMRPAPWTYRKKPKTQRALAGTTTKTSQIGLPSSMDTPQLETD